LAINNGIVYLSLESTHPRKENDFTPADLAVPKPGEGDHKDIKEETQTAEAFAVLGLRGSSISCPSCGEVRPLDVDVLHDDDAKSLHRAVCCSPCGQVREQNKLPCPKPGCGKNIFKIVRPKPTSDHE